MRLVLKLTLAISAGMCVILAGYGYLLVYREVTLTKSDMRLDHDEMGRAFSVAVGEVWQVLGEQRALRFIEDLNVREAQVHVRWVWLDAPPGDPRRPRVAFDQLAGLNRGRPIVSLEVDDTPERRLYTYVATTTPGERRGALELWESLAQEEHYIHTTAVSTVVTIVLLVALSGAIAMLLGAWVVGRPIRSLIDKARRVGAGDLSGTLALRQHDEIGDLAAEMNAMSSQLAAANDQLAAEVSARIATLEALRHADRLATVGKLASGLAHELGTPLNVVSGRAKMIASREVQGEEAIDNARTIAEQSERMTGIIRQLLDFARRRNPHKARVDVAQVVHQVLSLLTPLAAKRHVAVSFDGDGVPAMAEVDSAQIQQALTNLVVNGIHAMPQGGRVSVRLGRARVRPPVDHGGPAGEYLCLEVRDAGEGISEEAIDHIFEPFFTTKGIGEGTGLGLSVSYGIVREHGGWITVQSQLGKGSCFSIYLPLEHQSAGSNPHC
jgi:two-component system NtrC family sensor kinase